MALLIRTRQSPSILDLVEILKKTYLKTKRSYNNNKKNISNKQSIFQSNATYGVKDQISIKTVNKHSHNQSKQKMKTNLLDAGNYEIIPKHM